jgi:hypothetical protein
MPKPGETSVEEGLLTTVETPQQEHQGGMTGMTGMFAAKIYWWN